MNNNCLIDSYFFLKLRANHRVVLVFLYYKTRTKPHVLKDAYHIKNIDKQKKLNKSINSVKNNQECK